MSGDHPIHESPEPWLADAWPAMEPGENFTDQMVDRLLADKPERPGVHVVEPAQTVGPRSRRGLGWKGWAAAAAVLLAVIPGVAIVATRNGAQVAEGEPVLGEGSERPQSAIALTVRERATAAVEERSTLPDWLGDAIEGHLSLYGREYGPAFRYHGVVLVGRGDGSLMTTAGTMDVSGRRATSRHARYRIGSLTQQLLAVAVMRAMEQGRLDLDDQVGHLWTEYDGPAREVTVRQLLSHTAGVPNVMDMPEWTDHKHEVMTTEELVDFFEGQPLRFEPGTRFEPSNSNYILLGAMLEYLYAESLGAILEREVFGPAGMMETSLGEPTLIGVRSDLAEGKEFDEDEVLSHATPVDLSALAGAGGVVSSAQDMWRFHRALLDETLLGEEAKAEMFRPVMRSYALGWIVERRHGQTVYAHPGGIDGFNASMVRFEDGTFILALASTEVVDCQPLGYAVADLLYAHEAEPPHEWTERTLEPAAQGDYVGNYALTDGTRRRYRGKLEQEQLELLAEVEIEKEDGHLWLRVPGYGRKWLHHHTGERFFFKDRVGTTAEFGRGPTHAVDGLVLREGPLEFELVRVE